MSRAGIVRRVPLAGWLLRSRLISNLFETAVFMVQHRRFPNFDRTGYMNDLLHRIRVTESDYILRAFTSDKEFAKIYVRGLTGEDLSVPTLGIIRDVSDIDDYVFPEECVVKPTHMANEIVFVKDGKVSQADRQRMKCWMKANFGVLTGERHYMRLEPKIIIEPWLRLNGDYCYDYKMHVYQGRLAATGVSTSRFEGGARRLVFNRDWVPVDLKSPELAQLDISELGRFGQEANVFKPALYDKMVAIAEKIGKDLCYVRVDFYTDCKDRIYVGEISHLSGNARVRYQPPAFERVFITGEIDGIENPQFVTKTARQGHA